MDLHAYPRTIRDLLSPDKKYIVPRFQREYSWGDEEILEFWKDIISNITVKNNIISNQEYFIGSIVLVGKDESTKFQIVDGQQRLTTITILLSALTETFKNAKEDNLAQAVYKFIEGKDLSFKEFFKLENENPRPFLQKAIQHYEKTYVPTTTIEEDNLQKAYNFFMKRLHKTTLLKEFPNASENSYCPLLEAIRDQVLTYFKVIYITVTNEDDAYTIFETLNARGMDLSFVDLIKNDIFKTLNSTHPNDDAKEDWKKIRVNLSSREEVASIDTYVRHFWLSKYEFAIEDKIYKSFKKLQKENKIQIKQFLSELIQESENYQKVISPLPSDWKQQEEKDIHNSLIALNIFKVTQVRTLLIALLSQRNKGIISLTDLRKCMRNIENFHFMFTAICSSRASGLESKYSRIARDLRECSKISDSKKVLLELEDYFKEKTPEYNSFITNFDKLSYTSDETKYKKLIQYIFKKWEYYLGRTGELEVSNLTIEHIAPESTKSSQYNIGKIGNLLPLAGEINVKADTKNFREKLASYKESEFKIVKDFIKNNDVKIKWTPDDIEARTEKIADLAYNKIWKI